VDITCVSTAVCLVAFAGISARSIRFNDNICLGVEAPALREDKLQKNSSQVSKSQPLFPLLPLRACLVAARHAGRDATIHHCIRCRITSADSPVLSVAIQDSHPH